MAPGTSLQEWSGAGRRRAAGVLALALLSWLGCGPGQDAPTGAGQAKQADMVAADPTTAPPLDDLVPDAERIRLPVPAADNVGTLPGTASVAGGAATYTIDIAVPPGRRGMQPALALAYSSRTGNGVAGVGWSLDGASSIYRCPRTVAQDGATRGVDFSLRDRLCLDGARLMLVRGRYGQRDSEYRTERERFARITLVRGNWRAWMRPSGGRGGYSIWGK